MVVVVMTLTEAGSCWLGLVQPPTPLLGTLVTDCCLSVSIVTTQPSPPASHSWITNHTSVFSLEHLQLKHWSNVFRFQWNIFVIRRYVLVLSQCNQCDWISEYGFPILINSDIKNHHQSVTINIGEVRVRRTLTNNCLLDSSPQLCLIINSCHGAGLLSPGSCWGGNPRWRLQFRQVLQGEVFK